MTKLASIYKTDYVQTLDQHSQTNRNSSWVNDKGTHTHTHTLTHPLTLCGGIHLFLVLGHPTTFTIDSLTGYGC
jgi:hypothetical protein